MFHQPECSELVKIEDVIGDLGDLVDAPILMADLKTSNSDEEDYSDSYPSDSRNLATADRDILNALNAQGKGPKYEGTYREYSYT